VGLSDVRRPAAELPADIADPAAAAGGAGGCEVPPAPDRCHRRARRARRRHQSDQPNLHRMIVGRAQIAMMRENQRKDVPCPT